jgi:hypothetical protein
MAPPDWQPLLANAVDLSDADCLLAVRGDDVVIVEWCEGRGARIHRLINANSSASSSW